MWAIQLFILDQQYISRDENVNIERNSKNGGIGISVPSQKHKFEQHENIFMKAKDPRLGITGPRHSAEVRVALKRIGKTDSYYLSPKPCSPAQGETACPWEKESEVSAWLPHRPHAGPPQHWANSCSLMWLQVDSQNLGSQVTLAYAGSHGPRTLPWHHSPYGLPWIQAPGCLPMLTMAPDGWCDIIKHRLPAHPGLRGLW